MFLGKIKRVLVLYVCFFSILICTVGCKTNENEQKSTVNNTSEKFNVSGDNLSLDTDIEILPDLIEEIVVTPYTVKDEKAKKALLNNHEIISSNIPEDNGAYYYDIEGNQLSIIDKKGVNYRTQFYWNIMNCVRLDPRDERYNGDKFSKELEFDFMSKEEALYILLDKLKEMGIDLADIDYTCYSLYYKTLKEEEYAEDIYGKEDKSSYKSNWTKEDNCYYFAIRQKKNGIVEYHKYAGIMKNYEDCNSSIQAIVSKRGIESLEMQCALKIDNTGQKIKIIQPQSILDLVSRKYGKVIGKHKYTITSFNLCYMSDLINQNKVTPIYQCHMIEENEEGTRVEQLLFDAETGEELE